MFIIHGGVGRRSYFLDMVQSQTVLINFVLPQVWDEADYVVPPAENGAFFVTTNVVITPNQTWGECPEV